MVKPTTKLPGDPPPPRATTPEDGALPPSLSRWESSSLPVVERVASARVATLRTLAESLAVKFAAAEGSSAASLAKQMREVARELDDLAPDAPAAPTPIDQVAAARAAREAAADGVAHAGRRGQSRRRG